MTAPNGDAENEVVERNVDWFVTVTTIKLSVPIERLMTILKARKTTGDLCFHFNEGGIRRIELSERTKAIEERPQDSRKSSRNSR